MEHWQFWAFSFWFDIDSVRYRYFAIEGGFMIIDIPSRQCLHSHCRVASSTTTRTNVLREYLHKNEQFRETIFGCLYGAQEEFFFLVLKISWHCSFKVVMLCSLKSTVRSNPTRQPKTSGHMWCIVQEMWWLVGSAPDFWGREERGDLHLRPTKNTTIVL